MDILYQDESIVVVNKPSGLLTIRDGYDASLPTVKSQLENLFPRCWIVHRLDKETSGVLIVALDVTSHHFLNDQFQERNIRKKYHAIITSVPERDRFDITLPLLTNGDRRHRTIVDEVRGKPAQSLISILKRFTEHSLVQIEPKTGYTHQIRAHLSSIGYPILADHLYSKNKDKNNPPVIERTCLHSFEICFLHPSSKIMMKITAPYPTDFKIALNEIKKRSG